jgi:hypothetical protein
MMTYTPVDPNAAAPRPIPAEEQPLAEPTGGLWPSRFGKVFGVAAIVLTLAGLLLAGLAPQLVTHAPSGAPAGWTTLYDGTPSDSTGWDAAAGCTFSHSGLDVAGADGSSGCAYVPSQQHDLLSGGFQFSVALAPDGSVKLEQDPQITLTGGGSSLYVVLNQTGEYIICEDSCRPGSGVYFIGLSVAWHTDGYTPNSITLRYLPADDSLTMYTDGQEVRTFQVSLPTQPALALGADSGGEAIYTHVTLYSATGGS